MPVPTPCSNGCIPCGRGSACPNLPASAAAPGVAPARVEEISRLIWNDRIDAAMTAFFIAVVLIILADSTRIWTRLILGSGRGTRAQRVAA